MFGRLKKTISAVAAVGVLISLGGVTPAIAAPEPLPTYQQSGSFGTNTPGSAAAIDQDYLIYADAVGDPGANGTGSVRIEHFQGDYESSSQDVGDPTVSKWSGNKDRTGPPLAEPTTELQVPADAQGFGSSVAVDAEGGYAAVGARFSNQVFVYKGGPGNTWKLINTVTAPNDARIAKVQNFGASVAIGEGQLIIGAPNATVDGLADAGVAYVHSLGNGSTTPLLAPAGSDLIQANAIAGQNVVKAADGTVAVGAPQHAQTWNGTEYQTGAIQLFAGNSSKLILPDTPSAFVHYPTTAEVGSYAGLGRSMAFGQTSSDLFAGSPTQINSNDVDAADSRGVVYQFKNGVAAAKISADAGQYYYGAALGFDPVADLLFASHRDSSLNGKGVVSTLKLENNIITEAGTLEPSGGSGKGYAELGIAGGAINATSVVSTSAGKDVTHHRVMVTSPGDVYVFETLLDIKLDKTSDPASGADVIAGEEITYTLTARNENTLDYEGVTLSDDLSQVLTEADFVDGSIEIVGGSGKPQFDENAMKLTWTGTVPALTDVVVTYKVVVKEGARVGTLLKNVLTSQQSPDEPSTEHEVGDISLTKVADKETVKPGENVTYTVSMTNNTNVKKTGLSWSDDLSDVLNNAEWVEVVGAGATFDKNVLTWEGDIDPAATVSIQYTVKVNDDAVANTILRNAVVSTNSGNTPSVEIPVEEIGAVDITKSADKAAVKPGDTLTYTVTITNNTNGDKTGASWVDDLSEVLAFADWGEVKKGDATFNAGKLTWTGDLKAGESASVEYTVVVKEGTPAGTILRNAVTSDDSDQTPSTEVPVAEDGEINLLKAADKSTVMPGDTVTYSVTMTNNTNANKDDISWSDDLSDVLAYADWVDFVDANGATFDGTNTLSWNGNIKAGESVTVTYQVNVKAGVAAGTVLRNAVTSGDTPDTPGTTVEVGEEGEVSLAKTADKTSVKPGDTVTYTVTMTNNTNANKTGISWSDDLSEVLKYATWNGVVDGTATFDGTNTLTWTGDIPAGEAVSVSYQVVVNDGTPVGTMLKNAVVSDDTGDKPVIEIPVEEVGKVSLEKTVDVETAKPGDVVTYTVKMSNDTNANKAGVSWSDDLSDVLSNASWVGITEGDATFDGVSILSWTGDLAAGQSVVITYQVKVGDKAPAGTVLRNAVTSGDSPDKPGTEVPIDETGKINLTKAADKAAVMPGETITYTVTMSNESNADKKDVSWSDDLSAVLAHATWVDVIEGDATFDGAHTLSWSGDIAAGESVVVKYQLQVKDGTPAGTLLKNAVTSGDTPDVPEIEVPVSEDGEVNLSKTADRTSVIPGDTITYTIMMTNNTNADKNGLSWTDDLSEVFNFASWGGVVEGNAVFDSNTNLLEWFGPIASGDTVVVKYQVVVKPGTPAGTRLRNYVFAGEEEDTTRGAIRPAADSEVKLTKTADKQRINVGDVVTYTVTMTNTGDDKTGLSWTDNLATVFKYSDWVGIVDGDANLNGSVLTWSGDLAKGESATVVYQVKSLQAGSGKAYRNRVTSPDSTDAPSALTQVIVSTEVPVELDGTIGLEKTVDKTTAAPGDELTYTVTLTNKTNATMTGLKWSDDLSNVLAHADWIDVLEGGAVFDGDHTLNWTGGDILSGKSATVKYKVKVKGGTPAGTVLTNAVTSGDSEDTPSTNVVIDEVGKVDLVKTADKASVKPGETITYTVTMTNNTNASKKDISWSDNLSGVLSHADWGDVIEGGATFDGANTLSWSGDLAPGASHSVKYTVTVKAGTPAGTKLRNAVVSPGSPDEPSIEVPVDEVGAINVAKTADRNSAKPGESVIYTVTMTNNSNAPKPGVTWTDDLSDVLAHADWVQFTNENGASFDDDHLVTWTGDLAPGAAVSVSYEVKVKAGTPAGTVLRNAVTSGDTPDNPKTEVTVEEKGEINVAKVANKAAVKPGESLVYTVTMTNNTNANKTGVSWSDDLTGVLEHADWGEVLEGGAVFDGIHTVTWTGDIPAGQSAIVKYTVTVKEGTPKGTVLKNAVVSNDSTDKPSIETPVDLAGQVRIQKVADKSEAKPGEVVTYTVTMTNGTNAPKKDASWEDDLSEVLEHATWVDFVQASGATFDGDHTISWTGDLDQGASVVVIYQVKVKDGTEAGKVLRNFVTTDDSTDEPDTETEVEETGDVNIAKAADKATVKPGETITYSVTMTNNKNVAKTGLSWSDDLSAVLAHADWVDFADQNGAVYDGDHTVTWTGDLAPGESQTVSYTVKVKDGVPMGTILKNVVTSDDSPDGPDTETEVDEDGAVSISKVADKATVKPGDSITYSITMANNSNAPKTGVSWTDDLSSVLAHADWTGFVEQNGAVFDGDHTVSWTGDLAAGSFVQIKYTVTVKDGTQKGTLLKNAVTTDDAPEEPGTETEVEEVGDVSLAKKSDKATAKPGETITYTVTMSNNKNVDKNGISWSDNLTGVLAHADWIGVTAGDANFDPATGILTWTGDIQAGREVVISYQVKVKDGVKAGTVLKNVVTSDDSPEEPSTETEIDEDGDINMSKTADKAAVVPGDTLVYTVTMTNNSNVDKTGVSWSDDLTGVLAHADWGAVTEGNAVFDSAASKLVWTGDLAAGQSVKVVYEVTIKAGVPAGTILKNAVVSPDSPDTPGTETPVSETGAVKMTKTADKATAKPGEVITYSIMMTNNTNANKADVSWTDDLSGVLVHADWVDFVQANGATFDGTGIVSWTGNINAGDTVTVSYQVKVKEGVKKGTVLKNAVTSDDSPDEPEVEIPVEEHGDVNLAKGVDKAAVKPGESLTYTVTITNNSNVDKTGLSWTDDLNEVLKHADWVDVVEGNAVFDAATGILSWAGDLTQGESVTVKYEVKVKEGTPAKTMLRNAVTSGDSPDTPETETPVSETGSVRLNKVADKQTVKPGETITYTVTMTNNTNANKTDISWSDDLSGVLANADWVGFIAQGDAQFDGDHTISWAGDLNSGRTVSFAYQVKVKDGVKAGTILKNAVVSDDSPDKPEVEIPVGETGQIRVSKIADKAGVKPGESLTFTVNMTNDTNADKTDVSWSDDLTGVLAHADWADFVEANGATFDGDHTINWTGNILAGQSVTVSYKVTVKAGTPAGTMIRNAVTSDDSIDKPEVEVPVDETGDVRVAKQVDKATAKPGELVTYTVTMTNSTNANKTDVSWTDDLTSVLEHADWVDFVAASGATFDGDHTVSWTGDLAAGKSVAVAYQVRVKEGVKAGTVLKNAVVSDDSPDEPETETVIEEDGDVNVAKNADKAAVKPGETLTYTVTMTNNKNVDKTGLSWSDDLSGILALADWADFEEANGAVFDGTTVSWTGDLAAGDSVTVSYKVTVKPGVAAGTILKNAVVSNDSPDKPETETPVDEDGVVNISKAADKDSVKPGEILTYTVTMTNNTNANKTDVSWTDDLSGVLANAEWVDFVDANGATFDGTTIAWNGDIDAGSSVTVTYQVRVKDGVKAGTVLKNAVVSDDSPEEPGTETEVEEDGDVNITKVADKAAVKPGDTVTYTVTMTNNKNVDKTGLSWSDDLSDVLTYADWVDFVQQNGASYDGAHTVSWTGDLVAGASVTVSYAVKVKDGVKAGTVLKNAVVSDDSPDGPGTETEVDESGEVNINKVVDKASAKPGETVTYTVTLTNNKNVDKTGVSWSDDLSDVLAHADWDRIVEGNAVFNSATGMLTWSGDVLAGQSVVVKYSVIVKDGVKAGTVLKNAVVSDDSPDEPDTETEVEEDGDVNIAKVADKAEVKPGESVTYTVTMTNNSNADKTGISWSDDLSAVLVHADWVDFVEANGATFDGNKFITWSGDLAVGQSVVVSYEVKVKDGVKAGTVLKNAVVSDDSPDEPDTETEVEEDGDVNITKVADKAGVKPGETVTYTVTMTNNSNADKTDMSWSDDLSAVLVHADWVHFVEANGATFDGSGQKISWTGNILAGESVTVSYTVKVKDGVKAGTVLKNAVVSDDSPDNPGTETEVDEDGEISLSKVADKATVAPGDFITYTVTMTNNSNADKTDASWSDDLTNVLEYADWDDFVDANGATFDGDHMINWSGDVASGESVTISYRVKVKEGTPAGTKLKNAVVSDDSPEEPGTETEVEEDGEVTLEKSADKATVSPGDVLTYTVTMTNKTNADKKGLSWSDDLSDVFLYADWVGFTEGTAKFDKVAQMLTWVGNLAVGESVSISYQVVVKEGVAKDLVLRNAVFSNESEEEPTVDTPVDEVGVVNLDMTADKAAVRTGEILTYTVTMKNNTNANKPKVSWTDNLSDVLNNAEWVGVVEGNAKFDGVSSLGWTGDLKATEVGVVKFQVKAKASVPANTVLRNVVTSANSADEPRSETPVDAGKLHLTKSADKSVVIPGETLTYTVKATNTADIPMATSFKDDLSDVLNYASFGGVTTTSNLNSGVTQAAFDGMKTLSWEGTLAAHETVTVTYRVQVNEGLAEGTVLRNTVVSPDSVDAPITETPVDPPENPRAVGPDGNPVGSSPEPGGLARTGAAVGILLAATALLGGAGIVLQTLRRRQGSNELRK